MSSARCSMCHCFNRGCPDGLPNHRNSTPVGANCTMNSQGRHYRDPTKPLDPVCDYEAKGIKCDFFSSGHAHSTLPYPPDVSLGPPGHDSANPGPASDFSSILLLLQEQKSESEKRNSQLELLQEQVSALTLNRAPATTAPPPFAPSAPPPPSYSTPTTLPYSVSAAAATLAAQLNPGHDAGHGAHGQPSFSGNNMQQMGTNQAMFSGAGTNPLANPLAGMGAALNNQRPSQVTSVDQLYNATTVNKQLRAFEFAATGQFHYKNQLKQDNCNSICFAYGSFKHLEAAKLGLVTMSEVEFLSRLRHLKNVFEVACLSSNLTTFADPSWQVAREYDARVIADIESGVKNWDTLSNGLETDALFCAKETVELKNRAKKPLKDPKDPKKPKDPKDPKSNGCTTYNSHRSSDGCYWEHVNKGKTCVFEHFCSWCKNNRDVKEKHKLINCEHKTE